MSTEVQPEAEFIALRATIRERGTARMVLVPLVFVAWAAIVVATSAVMTVALSMLFPLVVLAAGFEATFALSTNVERIGRYLQVFHAEAGPWEQVSMEFGRRFPGVGPDPLFGRLFILATSLNFLPAALGGQPIEIVIVAAAHFLLINRIRIARDAAASQRAIDLERFTELYRARASASSSARAVPSQESVGSNVSSSE
jgi:hypothetical protein